MMMQRTLAPSFPLSFVFSLGIRNNTLCSFLFFSYCCRFPLAAAIADRPTNCMSASSRDSSFSSPFYTVNASKEEKTMRYSSLYLVLLFNIRRRWRIGRSSLNRNEKATVYNCRRRGGSAAEPLSRPLIRLGSNDFTLLH